MIFYYLLLSYLLTFYLAPHNKFVPYLKVPSAFPMISLSILLAADPKRHSIASSARDTREQSREIGSTCRLTSVKRQRSRCFGSLEAACEAFEA